MNTISKYFGKIMTLLCALLIVGTTASAQSAAVSPYIVSYGAQGNVDWAQGVIRGTGYGVRPERITNPGKARLMAREAALADAYRALAFIVSGVAVDGNTTVREHEEESQEIKLAVHAFIRNARIVSEADLPDGVYEVTLELPMWGDSGLSRAIQRDNRQALSPAPGAQNMHDIDDWDDMDDMSFATETSQTPQTNVPATSAPSPYSGLVIDARGLGVKPCMSPKILFPDGSEVWGTMQIDPELVSRYGITAYYKSMGQAMKNERTGDNPLIVKAVGKSGKVNGDVIVSEADGLTILSENKRYGFLDKLKVVFLIDPANQGGNN